MNCQPRCRNSSIRGIFDQNDAIMKLVKLDPTKGYPVGPGLFYRCILCGETVPSQPPDSMGCKCRNIFIDVDYARISVKCDSEIELLQE